MLLQYRLQTFVDERLTKPKCVGNRILYLQSVRMNGRNEYD